MATVIKCCANCRWYGKATYVCFHPYNEGMRVFDANNICKHYEM